MKKRFVIFLVSILCMVCLVGCTEGMESTETKEVLSDKYSIGDEVDFGGNKLNIYKIDDTNNELYLMAQESVATTPYSDDEHSGFDDNEYEGSLVEEYVNAYVDGLEDKGIVVKDSGIIDEEDLYALGFKHSDGLSGLPYSVDDAPYFVTSVEYYWVGGYCKYDTMSWAYYEGYIDTQPCENEYGVRPIIVIDPAELEKEIEAVDISIEDVISSDKVWVSEGGIQNEYDQFYFDSENMLFVCSFESSELSQLSVFRMKINDDNTVLLSGLRNGEDMDVILSVVNENKLRVRYVDESYNDGDYFLNKTENAFNVTIPDDATVIEFE